MPLLKNPDLNNHYGVDGQQVLVIGATGYFGKLLVEELIRYTSCRILAGGRKIDRLKKLCRAYSSDRIIPQVIDLNDFASWHEIVQACQVVICAAGPFQKVNTDLARLCIEKNVHYIDFADDRDFVMNIYGMVTKYSSNNILPAICSGWSTVPALSGVLTAIAVDGMEAVDAIYIQMAPGNRSPRSKSTIYSLLTSISQCFRVWQSGQWRDVHGWSKSRQFDFPSPIGKSTGYLVNVPDLEIFPQLFGAGLVEFRVSPELAIFNPLLSMLAWAASRKIIKNCNMYAGIIQPIVSLFGFYGHDWGGVGVEVIGKRQGGCLQRKVSLIADTAGQYIPVMPATIMVQRLLSQKRFYGLVSVNNWLTKEELITECDLRGYRLVVEENRY